MTAAAEVALVIDDPTEVDRLHGDERAQFVTTALEKSKTWLAAATRGTDPRPVAELRARAAVVAHATKQLGLAQEIQLDAQEMVRRAERGVGQTVRNGQEAGTIRSKGERGGNTGNRYGTSRPPLDEKRSRSPVEFFPHGGAAQSGTYAMTDGVTDEQFDAAIDEAKAEGNLTRANVVRKVQKTASKPPSRSREPGTKTYYSRSGVLSRDAVFNLVHALRGFDIGLKDAKAIDPTITAGEAARWAGDLSTAIRSLRRLAQMLKERTQ